MNVIFHHHRDKSKPNGGVTYAFEVNDKRQIVAFAIAKCHTKDNFCKHTGRAKAKGRLGSLRYRQDTNPIDVSEFIARIDTP